MVYIWIRRQISSSEPIVFFSSFAPLYIQIGLICVYFHPPQEHRIARSPPPPAHPASFLPYQWAAATQSSQGRRAHTTRPTRPPPPSQDGQLPSPRRPPTHPPALATPAPHPRDLAPPCPPCHLCTALQDLAATSMATPSQTAQATLAPREGLSTTRVGSTLATQVIRCTTRKAMWCNSLVTQPATRATSRGAMETMPVLTTTTAQVPQVKGDPFRPLLLQTATPPYPPTSATLATIPTTGAAPLQTPPTQTSMQWGSLVVPWRADGPPPGVEGPPQAAGTSSPGAGSQQRKLPPPGLWDQIWRCPPAAPSSGPQNTKCKSAPTPPHPTDKPGDLPSLTLLAL